MNLFRCGRIVVSLSFPLTIQAAEPVPTTDPAEWGRLFDRTDRVEVARTSPPECVDIETHILWPPGYHRAESRRHGGRSNPGGDQRLPCFP